MQKNLWMNEKKQKIISLKRKEKIISPTVR